jgi:hypothetical protein
MSAIRAPRAASVLLPWALVKVTHIRKIREAAPRLLGRTASLTFGSLYVAAHGTIPTREIKRETRTIFRNDSPLRDSPSYDISTIVRKTAGTARGKFLLERAAPAKKLEGTVSARDLTMEPIANDVVAAGGGGGGGGAGGGGAATKAAAFNCSTDSPAASLIIICTLKKLRIQNFLALEAATGICARRLAQFPEKAQGPEN